MCDVKKAYWYLNKGLAEQVSASPFTIRLKFEPKARHGADDPFVINPKDNKCVVCGSDDDLTVHHVVPYCFIKFMPLGLCEHNIHDCLALCRDCHTTYEVASYEFKKVLAMRYDVPITGEYKTAKYINKVRLVCTCTALVEQADKIPEAKKKRLLQDITDILEHEPTEDEIKQYARQSKKKTLKKIGRGFKTFSEMLVEKLDSQEALDEFAQSWRQHFVDTMDPQHMSAHWKIDRAFGMRG